MLVSIETRARLPDSLAITKCLAKSYPSMIPKPHESQILELLDGLHGINFFGLTFAGKTPVVEGMKVNLHKIEQGDISDRYQAAIDYKLRRSANCLRVAIYIEADDVAVSRLRRPRL